MPNSFQLSRLTNEEDQWVLALAIIEVEDLTARECQNVVNLVLTGHAQASWLPYRDETNQRNLVLSESLWFSAQLQITSRSII